MAATAMTNKKPAGEGGLPEVEWLMPRQCDCITVGHCPDCNHRGFVLGPRGGLAQNIECGGCGSRFNITKAPNSHHVVMAHRIARLDEGGVDWQDLP
jgi:hypothetical protein